MAERDNHGGAAPETVRVTARVPTPRVATRSYFSTHFLAAAEDAHANAEEVERRLLDGNELRFSLEHRGYVISSVILSAAFVEATINEVLQDAADDHVTEKIQDVTPDVRRGWAGLWVALGEGDTGRALDRYQAALLTAGRQTFDKGSDPWQSAQLVIRLRNHLVHYKPETVYSDDPVKLADALGNKVQENKLTASPADVDGWLSSDCARWAVTSSRAFVDEFAARAQVQPNYKLTLDDLRAQKSVTRLRCGLYD